jgi:chemotaxis protein MotB
MVLFTSMVLIILTFFIMLTAKANFDETKYGMVVDSVYETFGILTGGVSAIGADSGLVMDRPSIGDPGARVAVRDPEMARIRAILAPELLDDGARIVHNKGQRIISLSSDILFNRDSSILSDSARETLLAFCRVMRGSMVPIAIEGHTDNQPPSTEGAGDNWDVSMSRALAVMELFTAEGELSPDNLAVYAYAGEKPIVANNSPKNRAKNNRVDLVLDFDATRSGALRGLVGDERLFDYEGFEFDLPLEPGAEDEVY